MITIHELPNSVKHMVQHYNAWIVGSAADIEKDMSQVNDVDVIISFGDWHKVVGLIPTDSKKNNYGGWKYVEDGITVDVWPDDLNNFMNSDIPEYLWQPKYNLRYKKI